MKTLRIQGAEIVCGETPIKLRGVNLGNMFLVEHFMIGLPWTEFKMREVMLNTWGEERYRVFWQTYLDVYFTRDDAQYLASLGANLLRLPLNYRYFHPDGQHTFGIHDIWVHIDRVVSLCKEQGIYVLLDLHAAPGMQARDWNAESSFGDSLLWQTEQFQQETCSILRLLAQRYKDEPAVMGYDVLNEPVAPDTQIYRRVMQRFIDAVRSVDPSGIIVVEPNLWGKEIASFDPTWLEDAQIMVSPHHYFLQYAPWKDATEYPVVHDGRIYSKDDLRAIYRGYWDKEAVPRPYLMGEFGVHAQFGAPRAQNRILADALGIFESEGFHWTLWNYKDVGAMGLVTPRADTAWQQLLDRPGIAGVRKRVEDAIERFGDELMEVTPQIGTEAWAHLKREFVRDWHQIALDYVLGQMKALNVEEVEACARSWAFGRCEEFNGRPDVLRPFLKRNP